MILWKFCKKCGAPFDIGTNFDVCPYCRKKQLNCGEDEDEKEDKDEESR